MASAFSRQYSLSGRTACNAMRPGTDVQACSISRPVREAGHSWSLTTDLSQLGQVPLRGSFGSALSLHDKRCVMWLLMFHRVSRCQSQ